MRKLKSLKICNNDFKKIFLKAKKGDFVFIDPPYDSDKKIIFNSYNKNKFGKKEQIELYDEIKKLDKRGVNFLFTNHDTELIRKLYKNKNFIYEIESANRFINSNAKNRKNYTKEVFVRNY
jgi:DNA adenine methylase